MAGEPRLNASLSFLCEASAVLASSLDTEATLESIGRLAVPRLADWAAIDLIDHANTLRRVAAAHADPNKRALALDIGRRHPPTLDDAAGAGYVARTGRSQLIEAVDDTSFTAMKLGPEAHAFGRSLGLVSWLSLPLGIGGQTRGVLTLATAESNRRFGREEVELAEDFARRASSAIENARAYKEARDANRVKDEFLATMSHELRTPLNAILGWATLLRTRSDLDVKKAIETIDRNARAQVRLIEEVLDISRIMSGKLKLDLKPIDLATVLRSSLDAAAPAALSKGIKLEAQLEVESCPFRGDPVRMQQVFWNLLSNALKFTSRGGRVEARLARDGHEVVATITDTGRGIRPDFLPVVFQRFRQADTSTTRTEGGLGIGLAVVGHVVELHGGAVTAASPGEGRGATFTVRLPAPAIPTVATNGTGAHVANGRILTGLRVLVCEDDTDSRELLREVLVGEGATVQSASSVAEAVDQFRGFHPDVLVSDIGMPVADGYSLIRQIRAMRDDEGSNIPAIALTAYATTEDVRRSFAAGYQLHMAKPFDPAQLTERVARLAGRQA
jgi:signal transduction histidine kinase